MVQETRAKLCAMPVSRCSHFLSGLRILSGFACSHGEKGQVEAGGPGGEYLLYQAEML